MNIKVSIYYILFFLVVVNFCHSQDTIRGYSTIELTNRKTIHHSINQLEKRKVFVEACFDAIEKGIGIPVEVSLKTLAYFDEVNPNSKAMDMIISQCLSRYNVEWKKTSSPEYIKDPNNRRLVSCIVSGTVNKINNSTFNNGKKLNTVEEYTADNSDYYPINGLNSTDYYVQLEEIKIKGVKVIRINVIWKDIKELPYEVKKFWKNNKY